AIPSQYVTGQQRTSARPPDVEGCRDFFDCQGRQSPRVALMDLTQRLAGKVAVITGGASGIGLASAKRMRDEGATIVIGDIDPTTGKTVADDLNGTFVPVDVSDQVAVDALFDTAAETHGSVDIAFNNAGISPPEDDLIENTGVDAWDRVQDINLKSVFFCCKAA